MIVLKLVGSGGILQSRLLNDRRCNQEIQLAAYLVE